MKKEIKDHVARNNLKKAFEVIEQNESNFEKSEYKLILLIRSRFIELETQRLKNTLDYATYQVELNKCKESLLNIIDAEPSLKHLSVQKRGFSLLKILLLFSFVVNIYLFKPLLFFSKGNTIVINWRTSHIKDDSSVLTANMTLEQTDNKITGMMDLNTAILALK